MVNVFGFVYSQYPECKTDIVPKNNFDRNHDNLQLDRFLSGMQSIYSNFHKDRTFSWTYCKLYCDSISSWWALPETNWDAQWQRDCTGQNSGNAALIGGISYHSGFFEDRRWTFYCGHLLSGYETYDCSWTSNYVNQFKQDVDYVCPNNGILRGISSYHIGGSTEDRRWKFECCQVQQTAANPAQMNAKESDGNDHAIMTPESQNRTLITIVSISSGLCLLCLICGLCLYKRRKRAGSIYEHTAKAQDEDMDENMDENGEMETCVDGDIDANVCNLDLEKEELKVIDE